MPKHQILANFHMNADAICPSKNRQYKQIEQMTYPNIASKKILHITGKDKGGNFNLQPNQIFHQNQRCPLLVYPQRTNEAPEKVTCGKERQQEKELEWPNH